MSAVYYSSHPLIRHKITMLRKQTTPTREFRRLVEEIATLMCYEALADLPMTEITVETPIGQTRQPALTNTGIAVVPVLRAGLGMANGILQMVPDAVVGHIGMARDEVEHIPHPYYCKLPPQIDQRVILVPDPMLATGGSLCDAVDEIKAQGGKNIKCLCIIAAPEGVATFTAKHPDVQLYIGCLDRCLNENAYICPGLGDAGDRIFGTL